MALPKWLKSEGGLDAIEKRNDYKAGLLYDAIDNSNGFYKATVADKNDRSTMNVTFNLESEEKEAEFIKQAAALSYYLLSLLFLPMISLLLLG